MSKVVVAHVSVSIGYTAEIGDAKFEHGALVYNNSYWSGIDPHDIDYEQVPVSFAGYEADDLYPIIKGLYTSGDYDDPTYFYFGFSTYLMVASKGTTDVVWKPGEGEDTETKHGEINYIYATNVIPVVSYVDSEDITLDAGEILRPGAIFNKQTVDIGYHAEWSSTYNGFPDDAGTQDLHNYYLSSL